MKHSTLQILAILFLTVLLGYLIKEEYKRNEQVIENLIK